MLANILGAVLFMVIFGVGDAIALFVLSKAGVRDASVGGTAATVDIRRLFPVIVGLSVVAGAIVGWFAGPIVLEAMGVTL